LYKGTDVDRFREAMGLAAKALGGAIRWGQAGSGDQDLRLTHSADVHSVYLPYLDRDFTFCKELGRRLGLPWLELRIQEGSIWDYALYRGADVLDTFSVCPQYWEGEETDAETLEVWRNKPEVLADAWGVPVARVRKYLVNWGYRVDPDEGVFRFERRGKAYPTDEHPYGDYEQFFDILKVLGGSEPGERHTIGLPKPKRH